MENELSNIRYDKESLIVQANELIRSMQDDMSLLEAKLIKLVIAQIAMSDSQLMTYTCHVTALADFLEIPQDNIYRDMDTLSSSILTRRIYIKDKNKPTKKSGQPNYLKFQWVSSFKYRNGIITIRLNDELKPWLLGLHAYFTEFGYECILHLPTPNSMRLFELLKSYEYTANTYSPRYSPTKIFPHIPKEDNEIIFSIDYLKNYFNCADKYPANKDFIKWVINASVKSINCNQENMKVSYRIAKEGRKFAYVLFKINAWCDKDFMEFVYGKKEE